MIYETKNYEVLITKNKHRMQAQDDLSVYTLRNKTLKTIEGAADNLPSAINMCEAYQEGLDRALMLRSTKENANGSVVVISSKERPV
jgi:hypothetical protein